MSIYGLSNLLDEGTESKDGWDYLDSAFSGIRENDEKNGLAVMTARIVNGFLSDDDTEDRETYGAYLCRQCSRRLGEIFNILKDNASLLAMLDNANSKMDEFKTKVMEEIKW